MLTGDTLFVGDVGRPDLRASLGWSATRSATMLYDSLQTKLLALPDDSLVYPAHGAGRCAARRSARRRSRPSASSGALELRAAADEPQAFIELVTADQPDAPAYFVYDAVLNAKEHPTLERSLAEGLKPLTLDQVLEQQRDGAQVLDTREPGEFAAAHLAGSLNIGLGGQYATWAGTMLDPRAPDRDHRRGRPGEGIGDASGPHRLRQRRRLPRRRGQPRGAAGAARVDRAAEPGGGSRTAPLERPAADRGRAHAERVRRQAHRRRVEHAAQPAGRARARAPDDRPLLVHCAGGYRSSIAASLLQQAGFTEVSELAGGIAAWEAAGLPVTTGT